MIDHKVSLVNDLSQSAPRVSLAVEEDSSLLTDSSQSTPSSSLSNVEKPSSLVDSSKSFIEDKKLDSPSRNPSRMVSSRGVLTWYNGILGNVTVQKS